MCEEHKHLSSEVGEDLAISGGNQLGVTQNNNSLAINFPEGVDMKSEEVIGVVNNIKKIFSDFMDCYKN